jgi:integrase
MENADVAAYIGRWRSSSVSPQAAAFARDVITAVRPEGKERAKNLLWAAGKLAGYAIGLGLEPVPEVVLHPSVAERFTRCAPGLSPVARRTLRTNLRFIGRRVVPHLYPADMPLPRERAKKPYSQADIAGYLALADAQPSLARRRRAAGLVCLGAGAGLIRGDLRGVRGSDVACRSGGVVVQVRGTRPRAVPVLARYHAPAAGRGRVRRGRAGHRGGAGRPQERDRPAERLAGRRGRAAAPGHVPAARDLAA